MKYSLLLLLLLSLQLSLLAQSKYYFNAGEKNEVAANGSQQHPFRSLDIISTLPLKPGDSVLLHAGDVFYGTIVVTGMHGSRHKPIVFTSYGKGKAKICSGNKAAINIAGSSHFSIHNLIICGVGRKEGNVTDGVKLSDCLSLSATRLDIAGFQKAGLLLFNCRDVVVDSVVAHENGLAGILVDGDCQKRLSQRIHILNSKADNNPGDPTNFTNHSGNGILVGNCRNIVIEYCSATQNGWDMPRIGNGPVGIWAYEADSVIIQHCISYRNKTAKGAADGGGFDLDGGVTNSVIQYCLSYENEGSGYGIYQYWSAGKWKNNELRYCISLNDGKITENASGMYIWNGNNGDSSFTDFYVHHNFFYNDTKYAFSFSELSQHRRFRFYNNYFIASDTSEIYFGVDSSASDVFLGNVWVRKSGGFMQDGFNDFGKWARATGYEMKGGKLAGRSSDKKIFELSRALTIVDPHKLSNDPVVSNIWKKLKLFTKP